MYKQVKQGEKTAEINAGDFKITVNLSGRDMKVYTENGYVCYHTEYILNTDGTVSFSEQERFILLEDKLFNSVASQKESEKIYFGLETDGEYILKDLQNGKIKVNINQIKSKIVKSETKNGVTINVAKTDRGYTVYTENGYSQYFREVSENETLSFNSVSYTVLANKMDANNNLKNADGLTYSEALEQAVVSSSTLSPEEFIKDIQGLKSAEAFKGEIEGFLWVKNIWVTDGAHKHPVLDYAEFKTTVADTSGCGCSCSNETTVPVSEQEYNLLTSKLTKEKTEANGFYILCILSALISLASQIIMNKSQKAQLELQTVDGQGASNQKMMTWMMPLMMAVFSFMYTSAFSIYIIINTTLSILTTFIINKLVDRKFQKAKAKPQVVRGRVYTQKIQTTAKTDKKIKEKSKVEAENKSEKMDFLSGLADGKRPTKKVKKK